MRTTIWKEVSFEAAHRLPFVPPDHKCGRMHGHSFKARLYLTGELEQPLAWVLDYGEIKRLWEPLHLALDHNCLNDVPGLENPTSENLAQWIQERMRRSLDIAGLMRLRLVVEVQETCTTGARYPAE